MKKMRSFIIAMCLGIGLLAGCGEEKQEEKKQEEQKSVDFQEVDFHGYSFSVPEDWEKGENTEDVQYFYPETGMLLIQFSPIEGESILDKTVQQEFTKGFGESYENFELIQESMVKVAGQEAYQQVVNLTSNDADWQSTMVTYDCQDGWTTFAMFAVQGEDSYTNEFEAILDSIKNESGAVAKEEIETKTVNADDVLKQVEVKAVPTQDNLMCVFITNNSQSIIDELNVQVNYKNEEGVTIDLDEDGHDMVLPGSTIVSRIEAPEMYSDYEIEVDVELEEHSTYKNHSEEVDVTSNQGEEGIIVEITNNADASLDEVEVVAVLYQGEEIVTVEYPVDIYDVPAGGTVTEKIDTYDEAYDRFEIYLNQAHTFGLDVTGNEATETGDSNSDFEKEDSIHILKHGTLLDVNYNGGTDGNTLVIKAKIEPSMTNKMTIDQNYYNIEDIIINQGGANYNEIQYWAVADMESGDERKVISFSVDNELIQKIKNKEVVANKLGDYVIDLWILPSLTE